MSISIPGLAAAQLGLISRAGEDLEAVRKELAGAQVFTAAADVSKPAEVERAVNELAGRLGGLDALVGRRRRHEPAGHLASIKPAPPPPRPAPAPPARQPTRLARYAVPHLRARAGRGGGAGDALGTRSFNAPGAAAYAASKAATHAMAKMLAAARPAPPRPPAPARLTGGGGGGACAGARGAPHPRQRPRPRTGGGYATLESRTERAPRRPPTRTARGGAAAGVAVGGDVARAAAWLASPEAALVTGAELAVDGGEALVA
eukprot:tig00000940_g5552.t1